jgi:hypothetical protein
MAPSFGDRTVGSVRGDRTRPAGAVAALALVALLVAPAAAEPASVQASGFALLRGASSASPDGPLALDRVSAQAQLGLDWSPHPFVSAHVHVIARSDDGDSRDGAVGVTEAFVEGHLPVSGGRLRLRGGAMFLPTSLENVDALWQTPFTVTSSALNTWLGEELRPIGIDASFTRFGATVGGTLFRGNDTFGALPPVRGWALHDRWILLGEKIPVDGQVFTSVSDDTDGRLGWSARAAWRGRWLGARFTHVDNRSDGLLYGDLYNWNTRLDVAGVEATRGGWTLAAESGWGPTYLVVDGQRIVSDLRASYLLVSRRLQRGRASLRLERFDDGSVVEDAVTAAWLWTPPGKLGAGAEVVVVGGSSRALVQVRYAFSLP